MIQIVSCAGSARLRQLALGICLLAACACGMAESTGLPEGAEADERLYREALLDLQDGYIQLGIGKLQSLTRKDSGHFGALLDLAIAYCQSGHAEQAESLWQKLEALPQLPPAIGELIAHYRRGECLAPTPPWHSFVALGSGYGNNINQAPGNEFFYLGPLGLTLKLSDQARPQRDAFRILEAGISRGAREGGWGAGVFFQGLNYVQVDDFDSNLGQAHVSYRQALGSGHLDLQGSLSYMTLGAHAYSRGIQGLASALLPLNPSRTVQAGFAASVSEVNYFSSPEFRARLIETKGRLEWSPGPQLRLLGEAGWIVDRALAARPGGDKQGPLLQLSGQWLIGQGQMLEVFHRRSWLSDDKAYSPAFFGATRRQPHLTTTYIAWRHELPSNLVLRLEGRLNSNRDTLSLFDYSSSSLGLVLEWWAR